MTISDTPQTIGPFTVIEKVAEGGMCYIYLCRGRQQEPIAVKQLSPALAHDIYVRRRFMREASLAMQLEHRHIVKCIEVGDDPSGSYIAMEWMEGGDMEDYVRANGPLSQTDAINLTICVIDALEYAHSMNVLHRDIKPENIILNQEGVAKLADFGLAKSLEGGSADARAITRVGQIVGSPHYMSPEQINGHTLGIRTDFYGLGGALFFVVTGRPPFTGDEYDVLFRQVQDPCPDPREFAPSKLSSRFSRLIMRLLEKDPNERPASIAEIRKELTIICDGQLQDSSVILFTPTVGSGLLPTVDSLEPQPDIIDKPSIPVVGSFPDAYKAPTHPIFTIEGGASRKKRTVYLFSKTDVNFGRLPSEPNDVCVCLFPVRELLDATSRISRTHFNLSWDSDSKQWIVCDHKSRNGLEIDGNAVSPGSKSTLNRKTSLSIPNTISLVVRLLNADNPSLTRTPSPEPPDSVWLSPFGCDHDHPFDGVLVGREKNAAHHHYAIVQRRLLIGGRSCRNGLALPYPGLPAVCADILLYRGYWYIRNLAVDVSINGQAIQPGNAAPLVPGIKGLICGIPFSFKAGGWKDFQAW